MSHSAISDRHAAEVVLAAVSYTNARKARDLAAADAAWDRGDHERARELWARAARWGLRRELQSRGDGGRVVRRARAITVRSNASARSRRHSWRAPRRPRARARRRQNRRTLARARASGDDGDAPSRAHRTRGGAP